MKKILILLLIFCSVAYGQKEKTTYYFYAVYDVPEPLGGISKDSDYYHAPKVYISIIKSVTCDWLNTMEDLGITNDFNDYIESEFGTQKYSDWYSRVFKSRASAEEHRRNTKIGFREKWPNAVQTKYSIIDVYDFNYYCN